VDIYLQLPIIDQSTSGQNILIEHDQTNTMYLIYDLLITESSW